MNALVPAMVLFGTLRLSDRGVKRTAGQFSVLVRDNTDVFKHYFGVELFAGSLNIDVPEPPSLQADLDRGKPLPSIVIPRAKLINMPRYLGNGQAWPCKLIGSKFPQPIVCWIFRRVGSQVPHGVIEVVAREGLREPYGLQHGDKITVEVFS